MTIAHHPSEETLVAYANASLSEGNSLVVATHLAHCAACRAAVRDLTEMAGQAVWEAGAAALVPSSRQAVLSRLDGVQPEAPMLAVGGGALRRGPRAMVEDHVAADWGAPDWLAPDWTGRAPAQSSEPNLPLSLYGGGKWQWVGPGIKRRFIDVPNDSSTRVFMLKAAPGTRLPDHSHQGTEWTCVLAGAYRHDHGRFGAGDFDEADDTVEHNPQVESDRDCVCLVGLSGSVELTGLFGRVIQPFVRF